jgi:hypothetical protein
MVFCDVVLCSLVERYLLPPSSGYKSRPRLLRYNERGIGTGAASEPVGGDGPYKRRDQAFELPTRLYGVTSQKTSKI